MQAGALDESKFTSNAMGYFKSEVIAEYKVQLQKLGILKTFKLVSQSQREQFTYRTFEAEFESSKAKIATIQTKNGLIEQIVVK